MQRDQLYSKHGFTFMRKIIFILCIALSSTTYAEDDTYPSVETDSCKTIESLARSIQSLRQKGASPSEIVDKLTTVFSKSSDIFKKHAEETSDKKKAEAIRKFGKDYIIVLKNYSIALVQEVFLKPIQPTQQLKDKVIGDYTDQKYLECLSSSSDFMIDEYHKNKK